MNTKKEQSKCEKCKKIKIIDNKMQQKLSNSNKLWKIHRYCGNKIVIALIIFLLCMPFVTCNDNSSAELVVDEEALPISNFEREKCEQRCNDQVGPDKK